MKLERLDELIEEEYRIATFVYDQKVESLTFFQLNSTVDQTF
jgi:hypothetical protein